MTTYLLKTEPDDYSYTDLVRDGSTVWDGVSNPAACGHMRSVKPGDDLLIYHTGKEKRIAGLARATSVAREDPKQPGMTAKGEIKRPVFDLEPVKEATADATLAMVKADERFADFDLVRLSRLSAMPVPAKLDKILRKMAGL